MFNQIFGSLLFSYVGQNRLIGAPRCSVLMHYKYSIWLVFLLTNSINMSIWNITESQIQQCCRRDLFFKLKLDSTPLQLWY